MPFVEQFPKLTLAALRQAGAVSVGCTAVVELEGSELAVEATMPSPDQVMLAWEDGAQTIALSWSAKHHGRAAYLVCTQSERRCRALYLFEGQFVSREAAGLSYLSTSMNWLERREQRIEKGCRKTRGDCTTRARPRRDEARPPKRTPSFAGAPWNVCVCASRR